MCVLYATRIIYFVMFLRARKFTKVHAKGRHEKEGTIRVDSKKLENLFFLIEKYE